MDNAIIKRISEDVGLAEAQVEAVVSLLENGATAPFITHYRKELTGGMEGIWIQAIQERVTYYQEIVQRRSSLIRLLTEQGKLTEDLKQRIEACFTKVELEDLFYLVRPKKRNRAAEAREKGLEPLAEYLWNQEPDAWSLEEHADVFINQEKKVASREQALQGALDIIAEWIAENLDIRKALRDVLWQEGSVVSTVVPAKANQKTKYSMYYNRREPVVTIPSHRVLAIRRGTKEGILTSAIEGDNAKTLEFMRGIVIRDKDSVFAPLLDIAVRESCSHLLRPLIETEVRAQLKERADRDAIRVFQENLSNLLLSPPAGQMVVMGLDPGKGGECRLAVVDAAAKLLETGSIYTRPPRVPAPPEKKAARQHEGTAAGGQAIADAAPGAMPLQLPEPHEASGEVEKAEIVPGGATAAAAEAAPLQITELSTQDLEPPAPAEELIPGTVAAEVSQTAEMPPVQATEALIEPAEEPVPSAEQPPAVPVEVVKGIPPTPETVAAEVPQSAEIPPVQITETSVEPAEASAPSAEQPPAVPAEIVESVPPSPTPVEEIPAEPVPAAAVVPANQVADSVVNVRESSSPASPEPPAASASLTTPSPTAPLEMPAPAPAAPEGTAQPQPTNYLENARTILKGMIATHRVLALAIGSGTGARELEIFLRQILSDEKIENVVVASVNDAGVAIYASSRAAREEFPDLNVSTRCAISLARRLQDPMAELVKIDPKLIGVGQYQHDVDQKELHRALVQTVQGCVNDVGVNPNLAGYSLLRYVAGLNDKLARKIVGVRSARGSFASREAFKVASGIEPHAYHQAAGFLRIRGGDNPLDQTAIHPESYSIVERMAVSAGVGIADLFGNNSLITSLKLEDFVTDSAGPPTLTDIRNELLKPGRDPRKTFSAPKFRADIKSIGDLKEGITLEGTVTNVTNFGAFIDIGVQQDGLVHLSQMSNRFIRDPREAVKVGDVVQVKVISVEVETKRIGLSMKALLPALARRRKRPRRRGVPAGPGEPTAVAAALEDGSIPPAPAPAPRPAAGERPAPRRERPAPQADAGRGMREGRREQRSEGEHRFEREHRSERERRPDRDHRPEREPRHERQQPPRVQPTEVKEKEPERTLQEKIAILQSKFRGIS